MQAEQCPTLDDLRASIDHKPIRMSLRAVQSRPNHRRARVDVEALHTPEGVAVVQEAFRSLPSLAWDLDSTTHVAAIHQHLHQHLVAHLPVTPPRPRNPAFTPLTVELVRTKPRTRQRLRELFGTSVPICFVPSLMQ